MRNRKFKAAAFALCALLAFGAVLPAFADDIFFNTISDQVFIYDPEYMVQYDVGYTLCCSSKTDWSLQCVDESDYNIACTGTVKAGCTLSGVLTSMENMGLGFIFVAKDGSGEEIDRVVIGNNNESGGTVTAEYIVPEGAAEVGMVALAIARKIGKDFTPAYMVELALNVDGKEESPAAMGSTSPGASDTKDQTPSGNTEKKDDDGLLGWASEEQKEEVDSVGEALEELAKGAVKTMIILGGLGVGAIAVIIAIIKGAAARKAAAAAAAAAAKAAANAGAGAAKTASAGANTAAAEDTFVLKDPATGAETLYIRGEDGEWVSSDGSTVLDTSKIPQWQKDRMTDRTNADEAMDRLRARDTYTDRTASAAYNEAAARQAREDYVNKVGQRHGIYSGDEASIREKMDIHQSEAVKSAQNWQTIADHQSSVITAAEYVGKAADLGVDAIAAAAPVLKPAQYGYYAGRNLASNLSDAIVNGKDTASAIRKAVGETVVDVTQAGVDKIGYKFLANTAGDAYKNVLKSIDEGKISAQELSTAAISGAGEGTVKTVVSEAFGKLNNTVKSNALKEKTASAIKNVTKSASNTNKALLEAYQGGAINKTTFEGAKSVVRSQYVADCRQITKMAETIQNAGGASNPVYNGVSNALENMTSDALRGKSPFKWE